MDQLLSSPVLFRQHPNQNMPSNIGPHSPLQNAHLNKSRFKRNAGGGQTAAPQPQLLSGMKKIASRQLRNDDLK